MFCIFSHKNVTFTACRELVECFLDAGKVKDATGFAKGTAEFIEANVPFMYQKIFSLQVTGAWVIVFFMESIYCVNGISILSIFYLSFM